ncbi:hypothetical protein HHI36_017864, partial [Cryptolaemus montrouzieri]
FLLLPYQTNPNLETNSKTATTPKRANLKVEKGRGSSEGQTGGNLDGSRRGCVLNVCLLAGIVAQA